MTNRRRLPAYLLVATLGFALVFIALGSHQAHAQCAPGQAPPYCPAPGGGGGGGGGGTTTTVASTTPTTPFTAPSGNPGPAANSPSCTPPATALPVALPQTDGSTLYDGTLRGESQSFDLVSATPQRIDLDLAGQGSLAVQAGTRAWAVTVAPDGATRITPPTGPALLVQGAKGTAPGLILITDLAPSISYALPDACTKSILIGRLGALIPGAVTVVRFPASNTLIAGGTGLSYVLLDRDLPNTITMGGDTSDTIDAPASSQSLHTGARDVIKAGKLRDRATGGFGNDRIDAGTANDTIFGDRSLAAMSGSTAVRKANAKVATKFGGADRLIGGLGSDRIFGDGGNDRVSGGRGNDKLSGGRGRDRLSGGSGRDRISGGSGRDRVSGGSGNDTISVRGGGVDTVSCGTGNDKVSADASDHVAPSCEKVVVS